MIKYSKSWYVAGEVVIANVCENIITASDVSIRDDVKYEYFYATNG